jgi:hypothetical protein
MVTETLKALLIEENFSDIEAVRSLLESEYPGSVIFIAIDKASFAEALETFQPHIILSNHELSFITAAEALELTKK